MSKDRTVYPVPKNMNILQRSEIREWADEKFAKEYGKYGKYVVSTALSDDIACKEARVYEEVVFDEVHNCALSEANLFASFDGARTIKHKEVLKLIAELKEEPTDELILIRSKHPALTCIVDGILKGVL